MEGGWEEDQVPVESPSACKGRQSFLQWILTGYINHTSG